MQIIGHRGASGYKTENTLSSFQEAIALGVDMIELDVYVIKTGEVVVFHDDTVDRTTNGTGHIEDFKFKDLRKLNAGSDEQIPVLSEVLDLVHRRVPVNIELKGNDTAQPVAKLIRKYIKRGWSPSLFLVTSFNHKEVIKFAKYCPDVQVGALFDANKISYGVLASTKNAYAINVNANNITRKKVKDIHARGFKVFAYTVNTKKEAKRLLSLKVDGVFTNFPDRIMH